MTIADLPTGYGPSRLPHGLPADWRYPNDLDCPKCGYNLRMQREPLCTECGHRFLWQALLGVVCPRCGAGLADHNRTTCPECQLVLNWQRLFESVSPAMRDSFEYHPKPWRRVLPTAWRVIRPAAFWRGVTLETKPVVGRLTKLLLGLIAGSALAWIMLLFAFLAEYHTFSEGVVMTGILVGVLPVVTFALLPVFSPTLAQFAVRGDQLVRIAAYGWLPFACFTSCVIGFVLLVPTLDAIYTSVREGTLVLPWTAGGPRAGWRRTIITFDSTTWLTLSITSYWWTRAEVWHASLLRVSLSYGFALAVWWLGYFVWWRTLWLALHRYLQLDTPNTVALLISTQVIALLTGWVIVVALDIAGFF